MDVTNRFDMNGCSSVFRFSEGFKLSLYHPKVYLLEEDDRKSYQPITGAVMYLGQISGYDILFAFNHLARALSKHSNYRTWQ